MTNAEAVFFLDCSIQTQIQYDPQNGTFDNR